MKRFASLTIALLAACGSVESSSDGTDASPDSAIADAGADGAVDAMVDAAPPSCTHDQPFGDAVVVEGVTFDTSGYTAWLTADELTILYSRAFDGSFENLVIADRGARGQPFGAPRPLSTALDSPGYERRSSLSADGLTIYFDRYPASGLADIYTATRASLQADFGSPEPVTGLIPTNVSRFEPYLVGDQLYFSSPRPDDTSDLYVSRRVDGVFQPAVAIAGVNTADHESMPVASADGLAIYYRRNNAKDSSGGDIWIATRVSQDSELGARRILPGFDQMGADIPTWISPDNCRLYFTSTRRDSLILYMAERTAR